MNVLPGGTGPAREWGRPREVQGFVDHGPATLPVLPELLILTDRVSGAKWLLAVSLALALVLVPAPTPTPSNALVYASGEEPIVSGNKRIFASNGTLAFEKVSNGVNTQPIVLAIPHDLTRIGLVTVPAGAIQLTVIPRP